MAPRLSIHAQLEILDCRDHLEVQITKPDDQNSHFGLLLRSGSKVIARNSWGYQSRDEAVEAVRSTFQMVEETSREFPRTRESCETSWELITIHILNQLTAQDVATSPVR